MTDLGFTHIALPVADLEQSIAFYQTYAQMQVVHQRQDPVDNRPTGRQVAWLSDGRRPFVLVLIQTTEVNAMLPPPFAHLGVSCESRAAIDTLCKQAQQIGVLLQGPQDSGPPIGYWAYLRDPDGYTLELSYGQIVEFTVEAAAQATQFNRF